MAWISRFWKNLLSVLAYFVIETISTFYKEPCAHLYEGFWRFRKEFPELTIVGIPAAAMGNSAIYDVGSE